MSVRGGEIPPHRYTAEMAGAIEARWQEYWASRGTFSAPNPGEPGFDGSRPKRYVLDMFPYPSGVGLHVGHPLGYIATDIYARYLRMTGHNVLHAMGFDAFGLPAEEYARETGTHPRITTERNMSTMRTQLRRLGLAHDGRRGVATIDAGFYRWTQWIFLRIYNSWYDEAAGRARPIGELVRELESGARGTKSGRAWASLSAQERCAEVDSRRLAYLAEVPVNWCPRLGTVLANEEVTAEGRSERGNHPVYKRPLKQWMMRITAFAERLASDLEGLDWPESLKLMQRNWIGRSEGAYIDFAAAGGATIRVFTTRPDTVFGATYLVLSPEHPLVDAITEGAWGDTETPASWRGLFPGAPAGGYPSPREAVSAYRAYAARRSDAERAEGNEKTGVFTGAWATNPATGRVVPVFIADYVLMGYGTGAIMAVPAHDERDKEFARRFDLPSRIVVIGEASAPPEALRCITQDFAPGRHYAAVFVPGSNPDCSASVAEVLGRRGLEGHAGLVSVLGRGEWGACYLVHLPMEDGFISCLSSPCSQWPVGHARAEDGYAVNSSNAGVSLDGLPTASAKRAIIGWLESSGHGRGAVTFKLRDWLFSRQRYWGEPFPIVFDAEGRAHALPESMLPVELPPLDDFSPHASDDPDAAPTPPLSRAKGWVEVTLDLGDGPRRYRRETNTMPNWAGSCWYYLRYLDPSNDRAFCDPAVERYWMAGGVDLYVGGVEHAVLHLLYARFWHKVLFDLGCVSTREPFQRLFNQGYIQAYAFKDERGVYVDAFRVTLPDGSLAMENQDRPGPFAFEGRPVTREYGKMGKSLKNAIGPDEICRDYGCDTLRVYEMYMGPLEASKPWNPRDIVGSFRFLQRVWRSLIDETTGASRVVEAGASREALRALHKTIAGVRADCERLAFNTAIAKLIEFTNGVLSQMERVPREVARAFVLMLAPLAPHVAEELWSRLGFGTGSLAYESFPVADVSLAADDEIEMPVQVNGKVRGHVRVPAGADARMIEEAALAEPKVRELLAGKTVKKVIVVPRKMVNVVAG
jgi:leucyl-tRNA synthetase